MTDGRLAHPPIGVVGASARAAIHSLARAGLHGWAADLFADRDLKQIAQCKTCPREDYPGALPKLIQSHPPSPVIYTGGLENYPEIIAQIAVDRPLWGNGPGVLELVRDPFFINHARSGSGPSPQLIPIPSAAPNAGSWLRKPLRSSAGQGIRFATAGESPSSRHYFQEFVPGTSQSAIFISSIGNNDFHCCKLLGITEQLIGEPWLHAPPFAYCGNIGTLALPDAVREDLERFGSALTRVTGLRGLWGLDFILSSGGVYPVEVNPRYSAAVEVLELSLRLSVMAMHGNCFSQSGSLDIPTRLQSGLVGKAIYYAPSPLTFPPSGPWDQDLGLPFNPWRVPGFADIPEPLTAIEVGAPVLTLFAEANSATECRKKLKSGAEELDRLFRE